MPSTLKLSSCIQSKKVILLESLGSDWITSQWFALSHFWKDEFLSQSQRVHARIIAPAHTNLPRTNDFAWECNFCAAFPRFNQRYYANLPFLSSFLAILWWMCCYRMMYVYRLPGITAVLKSYSFPSHHRKCLSAKIIQGFQVCLSISPSTTHDKCAFAKKEEEEKKKRNKKRISKLCFQTFWQGCLNVSPHRRIWQSVEKTIHVLRFFFCFFF